jgi:hypothetical protein
MTVSQDGTNVLQVSLNDTMSGEYTFTQLAPINHANGQDENNQLFEITYLVTDGNGDSVPDSINISADDDTPVVTIDEDSVSDTAYSITVTNHGEASSADYHASLWLLR